MRKNFSLIASIFLSLIIFVVASFFSTVDVFAAGVSNSANICGYKVSVSANYGTKTYQKTDYVKLNSVTCSIKKIKGKKQTCTINKMVITYGQSGTCIKKDKNGKWKPGVVSRSAKKYTAKNPKIPYSHTKKTGFSEYIKDDSYNACGAYVTITYKEGNKTKAKTIRVDYIR